MCGYENVVIVLQANHGSRFEFMILGKNSRQVTEKTGIRLLGFRLQKSSLKISLNILYHT